MGCLVIDLLNRIKKKTIWCCLNVGNGCWKFQIVSGKILMFFVRIIDGFLV